MKRWIAAFLLMAGITNAAPDTSLRPITRAAPVNAVEPAGARVIAAAERGLDQSVRPELRPRKFRRIAKDRERLRKRGAICEDLDIQGEVVGRVKGRISGCGVANAVRVRSVSGIELSQNAVMDCGTAKALKTWVDDTAIPAIGRKGGGLKRLRVAAHYACRTRNNQPGGRISEHGKGRAIDISAVRLKDGTLITVQNGWKAAETRKIMRRLHQGACGPFGTVLGPDSDRFHRDHFHFDTARYRSGSYCR